MKKNKIVNISIIVIAIALLISIIYININKEKQDLDSNKETNSKSEVERPKADLSFAVFGDIHENIEHFQEAIDDFNAINPNMDALVLNGDIVDQGIDEQYDSVKDILNENKDVLPEIIIKNIGNHEFFDYDIEVNSKEQVQSFINKYLEFSGENKVYHDKWINGYHFISLGSEDGNSETANSTIAYLSTEQIEWFKEKLAEKYEEGKPIFVFLHQHLEYANSSWVGIERAEEIREILSQYKEVVLFSSHTHRDIDENSISLDNPFTIVNTGAIHYTLILDPSEENGRRREDDYINAIYLEVNGNNVKINGRDIKEKKWRYNIEISN